MSPLMKNRAVQGWFQGYVCRLSGLAPAVHVLHSPQVQSPTGPVADVAGEVNDVNTELENPLKIRKCCWQMKEFPY